MPATSTPTTLSPAELSYLHTSLTQTPPLRPDLRSPTEFRPLRAETDLLPTCNGSAHVSLTDGSEALVGIKAEVHRTAGANVTKRLDEEMHEKMSLEEPSSTTSKAAGFNSNRKPRGHPDWISLNVDISTLRDDDALLIFLSEMLREPLLTTSSPTTTTTTTTTTTATRSSLADMLVINSNWHWHLHIDILLLSPFTASGTSYPLPLLSLATHLALRSARLPKLQSQGEEDPLVDDDWESSLLLFPPPTSARKADSAGRKPGPTAHSIPQEAGRPSMPPITLLVMTVDSNIIFDPSHAEIAVADAVFAVSVSVTFADTETPTPTPTLLAVRTIETPARDTMRGVPAAGAVVEGELVPGVWRPRVGGVKREVLKRVIRAVVGAGADDLGVAREVFDGLEAFLRS